MPPHWPVQSKFKAKLKGAVHAAMHGPKRWELSERPVPKHMGLRFVVETNASQPFEVWWQVVNIGREAAEARQLRGEFIRGESGSPSVHWESTLYSRTHTIDAFIVKNGVCVARTAPKRVRIGR